MDTKLLNIIISSKKELNDFANNIGENIFELKYRKFARIVSLYYKLYNSCPTLETLIEFSSKNEQISKEYIEEIWFEVSNDITDPREYGFYLHKISKRYNVKLVNYIGEKIVGANDENIDFINDSIIKISSEIKNIGAKKVYKELVLKTHVEEWMQTFIAKSKNIELSQGLMTGFSMFDYYTNGLRKSEFVIIGGDTGSGKSIFLLDLATNCFVGRNTVPETDEELSDIVENSKWDKAYNVLFISLEMNSEEVVDRILSKMCGINNLDITKGSISSKDASKIRRVLYYWKNSPYNIKIVDMPRGCSMSSIQSIYDETCIDFMPDIVIIDYLGLMIDNEAESDADWEKLKNVSEQMHEFGRVNEVVVFSAVQLTSTKPKEAGVGLYRVGRSRMITHNANFVLQIEQREDEDMRADARIHCVKARRCPKFIMNNLRKEFQFTRFVDLGFSPNKEYKENEQVNNTQNKEDLSSIIEEIFGCAEKV